MISIHEIIKRVKLQEEVAELVLKAYEQLDLNNLENDIKDLTNINNAPNARIKLLEKINPDSDGIKILTCMLEAARYTYENYKLIGISDKIFDATIQAFSRFVGEQSTWNERWMFATDWWSYRHLSMVLFRVGELEYEIRKTETDKFISIHIPSNSKLTEENVLKSLIDSKIFFKNYYPEYSNAYYRCKSWLISPDLDNLLPPTSNIIKFKNLFDIKSEDYSSTTYISWIYNKKYEDYSMLPENTTLQRNLKKYLLEGKRISIAFGILKDEVFDVN